MTETTDRAESPGLRLIAVATLVVVAAVTLPPWLTVVAAGGRSDRVSALRNAPDAVDHEYARFAHEVERIAGPDSSILIVVPPELGGPRHGWYLYRSEWILAGRKVTPFFDPLTHEPKPERIEDADLLLFWNVEPNLENLEIVMQDGDGMLLRKR